MAQVAQVTNIRYDYVGFHLKGLSRLTYQSAGLSTNEKEEVESTKNLNERCA